jgi:hypothetical protein
VTARAQLALVSAKGSPGVSTLALALGWCWPGEAPVLIAEADPAGADLACRLGVDAEPGLASLAAAAGGGGDLTAHVRPLTERLGLLAGCVNPVEAYASLAAVGAGLVPAARSAGLVGVWDCGRLDDAAGPVLDAVDMVVVVCRADPAGLARTVPVTARLAGRPARVGVVVVGEGRRRRGAVLVEEAAAALAARLPAGVGVVGRVCVDGVGAVAVTRGPDRWVRRTRLGADARLLAERLDQLGRSAPADRGRLDARPAMGTRALAGEVG